MDGSPDEISNDRIIIIIINPSPGLEFSPLA
jgi:hypothetical protein